MTTTDIVWIVFGMFLMTIIDMAMIDELIIKRKAKCSIYYKYGFRDGYKKGKRR